MLLLECIPNAVVLKIKSMKYVLKTDIYALGRFIFFYGLAKAVAFLLYGLELKEIYTRL